MEPFDHPDDHTPEEPSDDLLEPDAGLSLGRLGAWCLIPLALAPALSATHEPLTQLHPPIGVLARWLTTASENPIRTAIGIGLFAYALRGRAGPPRGGKKGGAAL